MADVQEWLTTAQAAKAMKIGVRAVQMLITRGRLVAEKRGRDWFVLAASTKTIVRKKGWPAGKPRKKPPSKTRGK